MLHITPPGLIYLTAGISSCVAGLLYSSLVKLVSIHSSNFYSSRFSLKSGSAAWFMRFSEKWKMQRYLLTILNPCKRAIAEPETKYRAPLRAKLLCTSSLHACGIGSAWSPSIEEREATHFKQYKQIQVTKMKSLKLQTYFAIIPEGRESCCCSNFYPFWGSL